MCPSIHPSNPCMQAGDSAEHWFTLLAGDSAALLHFTPPDLTHQRALAFLLVTHPRLGAKSAVQVCSTNTCAFCFCMCVYLCMYIFRTSCARMHFDDEGEGTGGGEAGSERYRACVRARARTRAHTPYDHLSNHSSTHPFPSIPCTWDDRSSRHKQLVPVTQLYNN